MLSAMRPDWSSDRRLRGLVLRNAHYYRTAGDRFQCCGPRFQGDVSLYLQSSSFHSISVQIAKIPHPKYIGHFKTCSVIMAAGRRKPANQNEMRKRPQRLSVRMDGQAFVGVFCNTMMFFPGEILRVNMDGDVRNIG